MDNKRNKDNNAKKKLSTPPTTNMPPAQTAHATILHARRLLSDPTTFRTGLAYARSHMTPTSSLSHYIQAYLCILCGLALPSGTDKWRCCCDAHAYILKEMHRVGTDDVRRLDGEMMRVILRGMRVLRGMILRVKFRLGYCYALQQVEGVAWGKEVDCGLGIEVAVHEALGLDLDYDLHRKVGSYQECIKEAVGEGKWISPLERVGGASKM